MNRSRKIMVLAMALMLIVSMLAGCQSDGGASTTTTTTAAATTAAATTTAATTAAATTAAATTAAATTVATTAAATTAPADTYADHVDLSFVWTNWNNKSDEDEQVQAWLDEKFNMTFDWVNLASDVRAEKLGVMWAGGEKFTASFGTEGTSNAQCMSVQYENGWIYSVDEYWDYMPNIVANTEDICWVYTKQDDGKMYGIPESGCYVKTGLWVRQDWLNNVGLEAPETISELETVMDAFRNNDPDGDGAQNTYGISVLFGGYTTFEHYLLSAWLPYGESWQPKDDSDSTLYPRFMIDGYKDFLTTVADWSAKGYVHPNQIMFNYDTSIGAFVQGEVGGFFTWYGEGDSGVGNLLAAFPDSDPLFVSSPHNDDGQGGSMAQKLYGGSIVFNKQATEAEVTRYVQMLDYFCTEEGNAVRNYGVEGVQWVDNGDTVKLPEGKTKVYCSYCRLPGGPYCYGWRPLEGGIDAVNTATIGCYANEFDYVMAYDYMYPYKWTGTQSEDLISDLDKMITTAVDAICSGTQPVDSLDSTIETWLASGGQTYIDEYNAQYVELDAIYGAN